MKDEAADISCRREEKEELLLLYDMDWGSALKLEQCTILFVWH